MSAPLVCIQHFFNEEYLLPWWIDFHRNVFDHVVFVDHGSTDSSVSEISQRAPTWEVRTSCLTSFDAVATDEEVMEIEREFDCWKIVLNTTEFLWAPSIRDDLAAIERGPFAFHFEGKAMVDRYRNKPLEPLIPPPVQRPWCVNLDSARGRLALTVEAGLKRRGRTSFWLPRPEFRRRFVHGAPDGQYTTGRHSTGLTVRTGALAGLVLWLGYSPWTAEFRKRKLQIGPRIPPSNREMSYGIQHAMASWELELMRVVLALCSEKLDLSVGKGT